MSRTPKPTVFVIDRDEAIRDSIRVLLGCEGIVARSYASATAFLSEVHPERNSCIVIDAEVAELNKLDLLDELYQRGIVIPAIVTTSDKVTERFRSAVDRLGATLLEKPYAARELIANLRRVLERG